MKRSMLFVSVILLVLAGVSCAQDETVARFEPLETCFVEMPEGVDFECGHVVVPEFHSEDSEDTISIGVIRLLSPSDSPAEPLFHVTGGPGGSVMNFAASDASRILEDPNSYNAQILADRDMVYVEQRGAEFSEPYLGCDAEYIADYSALVTAGGDPDESLALYLDGLKACFDDHAENGIDISAFNSLEMAADVNAVRELFGYDKINFFGESYSTVLGQHMMREYPDTLNVVILDGVDTIANISWNERDAERVQSALDALVLRCQEDESCNTAYPNLAQDFDTAIEKLDQEPIVVTISDELKLKIDSTLFGYTVFNSLYEGGANVPLAVYGVVNDLSNDVDAGLRNFFYLSSLLSTDGIGWIQHFGVVCAEDPPSEQDMITDADVFEIAELMAAFDVSTYLEMCPYINPPPLPVGTDDLVMSDIPVLLLHGSLDPVTPRFLAEPITEGFTTSYSFEFPSRGHTQFTLDVECAKDIVVQFMSDPITEPDGSCIAEVPPLEFDLPEQE